MITFINKEVCRSNVIEKVHINFSGREFGMKRRRWRKRGEWRRCQLQLEATWDNFSECLWRMLGRLIRGIKSIQTKWHIDILVSVCKEGIRKGCYTDISLISSCSQIHPCDNCCTTWAHLGSPTVGAWWFFSSQNPSPKPPWFEPWSCELRVSGDPNLFRKTMENCGFFLLKLGLCPAIYTKQMVRIWGDRCFFKAVFLLGIRKMMSLGKGTPPETNIAFVVGRGLFSEAKKVSCAARFNRYATLGYWYRRYQNV